MRSADDSVTKWPGYASFPGPLGDEANSRSSEAAIAARAVSALWQRDPSAWSSDTAVQQKIASRLGWLDSPALMADSLDRLRAFAESVRRDGFTDIVLLGMGGSSLAPEVLRSIVGSAPGFPQLWMLDSTDPAAVEAVAVATPVEHTLYLLASKSGTTIEPNSLAAYFRKRLEDTGHVRWPDHFVAITDAGTELADRAVKERFRDLFINPSDIGGRYSALSFFGLVPAALMGQDIAALARWGIAMLAAADPGTVGFASNPAAALGLTIGAAARAGRDKLTLIAPPSLEAFGLWIEQLMAESTGKRGVGVVPVVGETPGPAGVYGPDRLFVCMRVGDEPEAAYVEDLRAAGAPLIAITLPEPLALGAEFVRWEIATAIAGAVLGINPFDEPNVQQAKDATRLLLDQYTSNGRLPMPDPDVVTASGVALTLSRAARDRDDRRPLDLLAQIRPGDYVALLAYVGPAADLMEGLRSFRMTVRDRTRAATTIGYGPRYLHSTGQLHKGGPDNGVFVVITATPVRDIAIPGQPFSFGTLELAQALGDFNSLDAAGRRALHVHLPAPDATLLRHTLDDLLVSLTSRT